MGWFQNVVEIIHKVVQLTNHLDIVFDAFLKGIAECTGEAHRVNEDLGDSRRPLLPPYTAQRWPR